MLVRVCTHIHMHGTHLTTPCTLNMCTINLMYSNDQLCGSVCFGRQHFSMQPRLPRNQLCRAGWLQTSGVFSVPFKLFKACATTSQQVTHSMLPISVFSACQLHSSEGRQQERNAAFLLISFRIFCKRNISELKSDCYPTKEEVRVRCLRNWVRATGFLISPLVLKHNLISQIFFP